MYHLYTRSSSTIFSDNKTQSKVIFYLGSTCKKRLTVQYDEKGKSQLSGPRSSPNMHNGCVLWIASVTLYTERFDYQEA